MLVNFLLKLLRAFPDLPTENSYPGYRDGQYQQQGAGDCQRVSKRPPGWTLKNSHVRRRCYQELKGGYALSQLRVANGFDLTHTGNMHPAARRNSRRNLICSQIGLEHLL